MYLYAPGVPLCSISLRVSTTAIIMDRTFAESSLADMTRLCLEGAREVIQRLEGKDKIYMQTRLADLRLWADSVGATAQAKASLDQRFQHRSDDVYLIRGLLYMLQGLLGKFSIAADNKSDIMDIMSNVNSTIDSLAILGVQIRRSGRHSRLRKADTSFDKNREKYHKFRAHLACIITSRPTEDGRPVDEGEKLHSVDYFVNLKLTSIQERLIEANLRRRHRFLEAQRHSYGLKEASVKANQGESPHNITEMPSTYTEEGAVTQVETLQNINETLSTHTEKGAVTRHEIQTSLSNPRHNAPMTIVTSASGLDSAWGGLRNNRRPESTATRITTITATARYPKAHASSEQKLIKCPCCCQAIPASEAEASQWKKHLANDISPYTCILENCPTPYNLFATHNEWKDHVMNDHPSQWQCPCCEADAPVFQSLSGVMNHIMSSHPDALSDSLEDLLSDAETKVMGIAQCPLCDDEGPQDSPELVEHVLQHVHDFSLRSLPWPTDPPVSPSKPVATFDPDYATRLYKDNRSDGYSFSIAEWAESVAPKKGDSGEISVVDSQGNELFLDMSKYPGNKIHTGQPPLQLCDWDQIRPSISGAELASITQSNIDYFAGNLYFIEESTDSWSSSRQPSSQTRDTSVIKKWTCTICLLQSGQGDDEYFRHLEDDHHEILEEDRYNPDTNIEELKDYMLHTAYKNGMDAMSIANSSSISSNFEPISPVVEGKSEDRPATFDPNNRVSDVDLIHNLPCESVVWFVRFSHDGKYLATGCHHSAHVYDVSSGVETCVLQPSYYNAVYRQESLFIMSLCFSRDDKYLVGGGNLIWVWDIAKRTIRNTFAGHTKPIYSVDFSHDGRTIVSGSLDHTVRLWDIESSTNILTLTANNGILCVAFSPDSKYVAAGGLDNALYVCDITHIGCELKSLASAAQHKHHIYSIAFSPSGKELVSGSSDQTIKIWRFPSRLPAGTIIGEENCIKTLKGHEDGVNSVAFTPHANWVISGSDDRSVRFWDPRTGCTVLTLEVHTKYVMSVAASPAGGLFASSSSDNTARIWSYRARDQ
ncbi:hypothetical protein F5B22DRAFT_608481 [Xylaria bambusicola]|uniref:uncharacterized protein n=1 Tax=Xylaria bambusicola TaxID=326684 RepID=UPI00200764FF|nr:uncharacterized protein F5B22DRAFT_608481 [Xylaria bambusicola]KAI0515129.1 hypothetical protein F5B22DRAFT_608481 [Xylaria bambusicola]